MPRTAPWAAGTALNPSAAVMACGNETGCQLPGNSAIMLVDLLYGSAIQAINIGCWRG